VVSLTGRRVEDAAATRDTRLRRIGAGTASPGRPVRSAVVEPEITVDDVRPRHPGANHPLRPGSSRVSASLVPLAAATGRSPPTSTQAEPPPRTAAGNGGPRRCALCSCARIRLRRTSRVRRRRARGRAPRAARFRSPSRTGPGVPLPGVPALRRSCDAARTRCARSRSGSCPCGRRAAPG